MMNLNDLARWVDGFRRNKSLPHLSSDRYLKISLNDSTKDEKVLQFLCKVPPGVLDGQPMNITMITHGELKTVATYTFTRATNSVDLDFNASSNLKQFNVHLNEDSGPINKDQPNTQFNLSDILNWMYSLGNNTKIIANVSDHNIVFHLNNGVVDVNYKFPWHGEDTHIKLVRKSDKWYRMPYNKTYQGEKNYYANIGVVASNIKLDISL